MKWPPGRKKQENPFMRLYAGGWKTMSTPLKGRPRLNISLASIIEAVRAHGNQSWAAADLGCSEASVRKQIRLAGLDLAQVLDAETTQELLADKQRRQKP